MRADAVSENGSGRGGGLTEKKASFGRRNRWVLWVAGCLGLVVAGLAVAVAVALHHAEPFVRAQIVSALEERFHARVELDSFHVSLVHGLRAQGQGLRIWAPRSALTTDVPAGGSDEPLIRVAEFRFRAPLHYKPGTPIRISVVELKGLDVRVPPRSRFAHDKGKDTELAKANPNPGSDLLSVRVDTVECLGTRLTLETDKPGKLPIEIAISRLKLTGFRTASAEDPADKGEPVLDYEAELTNPKPVGRVNTSGTFGPWHVEDPGESSVTGDYVFSHADLGSFKELAGTLSSTGHYGGTLRDLTVDGQTDTPDFQLKPFNNPQSLHTKFHAKVDGTNGDTWLQPVEATLGHSHFTAEGKIVRVAEPAESGGPLVSKGHDIALVVNVDRGRIEDFLRLASHSSPVLNGAVTTKTTLHIPPGAAHVVKRVQLKGSFNLDDAVFTSEKIQDRIRDLSLRGLGRPKEVKATDPQTVDSTMSGDFQMADGVITLPVLKYGVPGAAIQLKGTYAVEGGAIDFAGSAALQATVSQMVGGWKGLLLKPADRFFKKDGAGTEVPIHISGTREDPKFEVNLGMIKKTSPETPGQK
ncbi:MAG: AsmA-like C-terminal region-containing protein [Terracidiphilus sp.]